MCGHRRLKIDTARHQRRVFRHERVLEQQRARHRATHAQRIPIAHHGYAVGFGRHRKVERVAAGGLFAFDDFGAEHAIVIGVARERGKNLLAVDEPAAFDRLRLGAERDATGCRRAAFREWLRVNRAILDNAFVMYAAPAFMFGPGDSVHLEIVGQRAGPQRRADMHIPGQRGGTAIAADLGSRQRIGLVVGTEAAVLSRDRDAEQVGAMQVPVILDRKSRVAIVGRGAACKHALAKLVCGRDDRGLFVVQPERPRIEDRRVQIDFVDRLHALAGLHRHHAVTCVAATLVFRKESSAALKAAGRSRLARWPTPSSSAYFANGI
jgi:hypothetical protein